MSDSFGARLRHERERRQISLETIAESTKISISLLEGLERDNVSRWPTGIFRKAFIRDYAKAIGLDPELVCSRFGELYPDPTDVVPAAPDAPAVKSAQVPAAAVIPNIAPPVDAGRRVLAQLTSSLKRIGQMMSPTRQMPPVLIKFTIVSPDPAFRRGTFLSELRKRWAAAACDAGVSFLMALCLFAVLGRFWTPLGVSMLCYYVGGIVILGNTPGVCLFAPERGEDSDRGPLRT